MKKRKIKTLIVVVILAVPGCGYLIYGLYRPKIGPCSGRVVDAVTGEPIEGAIVSFYWDFTGTFVGYAGGGIARTYETTTDPDGRYFVPVRRVVRDRIFDGFLMRESVLVYKDGYAAYKVYEPGTSREPQAGRCFGHIDEWQSYSQQDNLVQLCPWKEGESHNDHYRFISHSKHYAISKSLQKELEKELNRAKEESERERNEKRKERGKR